MKERVSRCFAFLKIGRRAAIESGCGLELRLEEMACEISGE